MTNGSASLWDARLFIDWCPTCGRQVRAFGGSHSLNDGGLIPQSATEHATERIQVVSIDRLVSALAYRESMEGLPAGTLTEKLP